ncbi:MAG TPA: DUF222 domain-containing protein [Trebonia sp.]|nr:DUF222 domain-containing protein [Trebonia sp.]
MDRQAADDWQGGTPGQDADLPALLAAFEHGGAWEAAVPSAALAVALERAAGPGGLYDGADVNALVGIVRQWAAVESWAAAGLMGALRSMMREDAVGSPLLRRRTDLPDGWNDSLNYEIAAALSMGPVSAGNLAGLAWTLGMRLPGIGRLLADGTLTRSKARLVAQVFEPLDEDEAARAEALVLGELAGKTWPQVERLAWRAALAVAPDVAERRRSKAEARARVTVFREEAGTAGLSGRDLPAAEALAGHANVVARARVYEASGAFPGQATSRLQAQAYLDLLNGVPARDRIAFAAATPPNPPDEPSADDDDGDSPGSDDSGADDDDDGPGPDDDDGPDGPETPEGTASPLAEVTVPLATLQGRAARAGDNRLLGPLDPALARHLAAAAARCPHSRWEITVVDEHGYATGHGIARPARSTKPPPSPPLTALPARVNIIVTETFLRQLAQNAQPRSGAPPGDWELTRSKHETWKLTLPGGKELTVSFDVVPTHACDHRYQTSSYQPGERLRRLVQVRDHECTFPTCSRAARDSDFEHAVPFDEGGKTDACNAGARSRRCHQVKQSQGWTVTQPKPGWHQWTTPTGRTYTQEPWRYTA